MKILVLGGGTSLEREVSLRSAKNVSEALTNLGYDVENYDPKDGLEELVKLAKSNDLVFPILHGNGGEDGSIQEIFEKENIKFLGAKSESLKVTFDKDKFKRVLNDSKVLTPKGEVVNKEGFQKSALNQKPFVLKPISGGSAIDTIIARTVPINFSKIEEVFSRNKEMLLEELILGKEITVGILDKEALPLVEIVPPEGEEFDFENRYNNRSQEFCPPIKISLELQQKAQEIALEVHKITGSRHLSRVDMILGGSEIFVLELNAIPGLTSASLYPKEAKAIGLDFEKLMERFVHLTLNLTK